MKSKHLVNIFLTALLLALSFVIANAQDPPEDDMPDRPPVSDQAGRGFLMRELGLTQEQVRMIRMLNQQRRPLMQEAQRRQRVAMIELDKAIYANSLDEPVILERLKELQLAQAEFSKVKATNELEVRKILTPEQLVKFRELRQRMMNRPPADQRPGSADRPIQRAPQDRRQQPNRRPGDRPARPI